MKTKTEKERKSVKIIKLSFYDKVSDEEKEKILNYYFEVFPSFKIKYMKADEKTKQLMLKEEIKKSKEYQEKFLKDNINLIRYVVNFFGGKNNYDDLMQEGYLGMIKALEKYDFNQETKFSYFAAVYIKNNILHYLRKTNNGIKVQESLLTNIKKYNLAYEALTNRLHRKPTIKELAKEAKISEDEIKEVIIYKSSFEQILSTDALLTDSDINFYSFVTNQNEKTADDIDTTLFYENIKDRILNLDIDDKTRQILCLRFGLIDGKPKSLEEISKITGLNRIYLRKIEASILKYIRTYFSNKESIKQGETTYFIKPKTKHIEISEENKEIIEHNLQFLDNVSLLVIKLYYEKNMNIQDISEILKISENDIKKIIDTSTKKITQNIKYKEKTKRRRKTISK